MRRTGGQDLAAPAVAAAAESDDPLTAALDRLVPDAPGHGFGADIDEAHTVLLSAAASREEKEAALRRWFGGHQPCVFAKVAARPDADPALDICWVDEEDLARGAEHVEKLLQQARERWKLRALAGRTSSLQVMFNSARLAHARPGPELLEVFRLLVGLYLPEWAPIAADTICLDGVPLRRPDGRLELFAASMTVFFTGAHLTRAHDHRVPGGMLLNVNAVGHHTQAAHDAGRFRTHAEAVRNSHGTALRSVGNGGIGHPTGHSSTWHLGGDRPTGYGLRRPPRPGHLPADADPERYGSLYHIDVTVSSYYADPTPFPPPAAGPAPDEWTMMLDYFTAEESPAYHNAALMTGLPIGPEQLHDAPWRPEPRPNSRREF
ncbi:hypothetical protein [Kitasatospora cheerisanensis]|uniref:hypothetical protein n=1 Tax=Kitasatospora cheerisanensis TaxID=81942 RepID=UPI00142FB57F|nr:hypothetical protein [Kitasatospora cheerisanensis]